MQITRVTRLGVPRASGSQCFLPIYASWLVDLTAAEPVRKWLDTPAAVSWSPDGSEVWYAPAMIGYSIEAQAGVPLLSLNVFGGERQTMYALSFHDMQRHRHYAM